MIEMEGEFMKIATKKYNPGFLSDDELVDSFCVRTSEFESIVETLHESTGNSNPHMIVIGPRGMGKTHLLLRVAVEMRRNAGLAKLFPVVFAEESYEVGTCGEFWLECLNRLSEQAPVDERDNLRLTYQDLRTVPDDRTLADRCLGALLDFSDCHGQRLVLLVENLNMLFADMMDKDAGWRLRKTLQTEPRIILLGSATSRFNEIDHPDHALYDLFGVITLHPLDTDECRVLWQTISGQDRPLEAIRALRILTGGNPRLLTIVARFGANLSFRELMADLLDLVDDHTEYFKSHLDALPAQERRVYLALAGLWIPATTREIAERARLDTSKSSAQLARLVQRGSVEVTGGSARRKQYYLTERLYNIYYLMRRSRGMAPLVEALIQFMEAYYSPSELKGFAIRTVREAMSLDDNAKRIHRIAFDRLLESPSLSVHREELSTLTSWIHQFAPGDAGTPKMLFNSALEIAKMGHESDAITLWDEAIQRLETSNAVEDLEMVAAALNNKGIALEIQNRTDEAFATWDEVVRRFGSSKEPKYIRVTVQALNKKALVFHERGQLKEALAICDEVLHRLKQVSEEELPFENAEAFRFRGFVFCDLGQPGEALRYWDKVVQRFGASDDPAIRDQVDAALQNKGTIFAESNRLEEALAAWDEILERFGASDSPTNNPLVAKVLVDKGASLIGLNRLEEALEVFDEFLERFGASDSPSVLPVVAKALVGKGMALVGLNRQEEALEAWDETLKLPAFSDDPTVDHPFSVALANKSILLDGMGRKKEGIAFRDEAVQQLSESKEPRLVLAALEALKRIGDWLFHQKRFQEVLATWDEIVRRFGSTDTPMICDAVAAILNKKGETLAQMNRPEEALAVWEDVDRRFGSSDTVNARVSVASSLLNRGILLTNLNRPLDAINAMDDVIQRFGSTSMEPSLEIVVSTALLGKARALTNLDRLQDAVAVYDEVLIRSNLGTTLESLGSVAGALVSKGDVLVGLNRPEEALATWDEVLQRFGTNNHSMLQLAAKMAQLKIAELHLTMGRSDSSLAAVGRLFEPEYPESPEIGCMGCLTRARAHLLGGNKAACIPDVETALSILSGLGFLPKEVLDGLCWLAVELGPAELRELIVASPASDLLLPLTTALERELGIKTRVAREVEEVAEDIQRDLEERRKKGGS